MADQPPRHIGLEPAESCQHLVEGAAGVVELAHQAAPVRLGGGEVEAADGFCRPGEREDRPTQKASKADRGQQRDQQHGTASEARLGQPAQLALDVLLMEIRPDDPGRRSEAAKLAG